MTTKFDKNHCIKEILIIVLLATLANADTWEEIADFARGKRNISDSISN